MRGADRDRLATQGGTVWPDCSNHQERLRQRVSRSRHVSSYNPVLRHSLPLTFNRMEYPLALYIFSTSQSEINEILSNTQSGGVTINDVIMHVAIPNAPFGGVGGSGYGAYHGKYGFDAFSHERSVVALPNWLDKMLAFRYPPYTMSDLGKIRVRNNMGFKRGEGMADQKIGKRRGGFRFKLMMLFVVLISDRLLKSRHPTAYWQPWSILGLQLYGKICERQREAYFEWYIVSLSTAGNEAPYPRVYNHH